MSAPAASAAAAAPAAASKSYKYDEGSYVVLDADSNQARGLAEYAIDMLNGSLLANVPSGAAKGPDAVVLQRTELFHTDSVVCGLSALALGTNAPTVLRAEALDYEQGAKSVLLSAKVFGSKKRVVAEKAIAANVSAVREWDSNGTVFGFNPRLGKEHMAGEFGHNDFYQVVVAACQAKGLSGDVALLAMLLTDEIRGRLAEVFSLKTFHIDHVVHGAIASAAVYGALVGATVAQIESAIGMVVAHYIPFRAIRAGEQLSDSKGASAALSSEVAVMSVHRSIRGFVGPADIFRNPEAIFRKFKPTTPKMTAEGNSPFRLVLTHSGLDWAVMGMHFKLGLYEHQSAGALQGVIDIFRKNPSLLSSKLKSIKIIAYQPAFGIIGDPSKRRPETRQSADHSMVYIIATLIKKARSVAAAAAGGALAADQIGLWSSLMLLPIDYSRTSIRDADTQALMKLIEFEHGGPSYDEKYPEGIPTSVVITTEAGESHDSGMVLFPAGHARYQGPWTDIEQILKHKFETLAALAVADVPSALSKLTDLKSKKAKDIESLYEFDIAFKHGPNVAAPAAAAARGKGKKRVREDEPAAAAAAEPEAMEY